MISARDAVHRGEHVLHAIARVPARRRAGCRRCWTGRSAPATAGRHAAAGRTGDLARQMGDQEGDVEAAGEEAGVQAAGSCGRASPRDCACHGAGARGADCVAARPRRRCARAASGRAPQRDRRRATTSRPSSRAPMMRLRDRREHELAERSAGIDEAGGRRAFGRQALRGGADQDREAAGARADRREQAQRDDQPEARAA